MNTRRRAAYVVLPLAAVVAAAVVAFLVFARPAPAETTYAAASANYAVQVRLARAEVGDNTVDVAVDRLDHGRVDLDRVTVDAVMARMGHVMPELVARPDGAGRFQARGELFLMSGVWTVQVRMHGPAGAELAAVTVTVP